MSVQKFYLVVIIAVNSNAILVTAFPVPRLGKWDVVAKSNCQSFRVKIWGLVLISYVKMFAVKGCTAIGTNASWLVVIWIIISVNLYVPRLSR